MDEELPLGLILSASLCDLRTGAGSFSVVDPEGVVRFSEERTAETFPPGLVLFGVRWVLFGVTEGSIRVDSGNCLLLDDTVDFCMGLIASVFFSD